MAGTPALTPRLSVIVVAHDSGDDLLHCVRSVFGAAHGALRVELILVDNASTDRSLCALPASPELRLLLNPDNRGFARACNQGAELARADTLLFLNPDCVLPPDALTQLLSTLEAHPGIGILGAQLLNEDGSAQAASARDDPSPLRAVRAALGLRAFAASPQVVRREVSKDARSATSPPQAVRPEVSKDERSAPSAVRVDAISGALMLMRRDTFQQLGGFDEGYVFHCEDLDLCRRARLAGHAVAMAPQVRVLHRKGTSSRARPLWVEWHKHRGMWRYFQRFDGPRTPWPARALLALGLGGHFLVAVPRTCWQALRRRS